MFFEAVAPLLAPIVGSIVAGGLIGFEREFRGRPAGFRTHTLVCLASALLMLAASRQGAWLFTLLPGQEIVADPTRMAHGVLTGIGFLCAGVIFREGFSIHGLTTAASLWITAALGILFGVGLFGLAVVGAVTTLVILALLRVVGDLMPQRSVIDVVIRHRRDQELSEETLQEVFGEAGLKLSRLAVRLRDEGRIVELTTKVYGFKQNAGTELSRRLLELPQVLEFKVWPRDD